MAKEKKQNSFGETSLKKGDMVMIIAGGNKKTKPLKGQVGKILSFEGDRQRAIVEGLNLVTRHQRAKGPGKPSGKIQKEAPLHVSKLMYYVEKIKRPVRLKSKTLTDGKKVRGYKDAKSGEFVQLAE